MRTTLFPCLLVALSSCGGPAIPADPPPSSAISPRAPSARLAKLGSSFEDRPLTAEESRPMDHSHHPATHDAGTSDPGAHHQHRAAHDAGTRAHDHDRAAADAGPASHGGHHHAP